MAGLSYQLIGDRQKPTVVFLHGFLGSGADFRELTSQLTDRFTCLLIDLPGHGRSRLQNAAAYSMPMAASLVLKLLTELRMPPVDLYGYSMGGRLAMYLAIHHKEYFRKTIVESASPGLQVSDEQTERQRRDQILATQLELMTENDFRHFLQRWYEQPLFQSLRQHPDFCKMLSRRLCNQPALLAKSLRYMGTGTQPNLWPFLGMHDQPLHLITGEFDQKFVALQADVQRACLVATSSVIQQVGHNVHLENPTAIIRTITNFFAQVDLYNAGDR